MSWIHTSLVSGFQSICQAASRGRRNRLEVALEDIREAMLTELGDSSVGGPSKLELKIIYAGNLQDLWYLRGDVMAAIAAVDGEALASQRLSTISAMFSGLLPEALSSRPRRLSD